MSVNRAHGPPVREGEAATTSPISDSPSVRAAAQPAAPPAPVTFEMPSKDEGRRMLFNTFAQTIEENPARFNLTPGDAAKLTQLAAAFDAAYHLAMAPAMKCASIVEAKNHARDAALKVFREYIKRIRNDAAIAVHDKFALGYKPGRATPRAPGSIRPPDSFPMLNIGLTKDGDHVLHYADSDRPTRKTKPKGVACLELHISISPTGNVAPHPPESCAPADKHPADELIRTVELTRNPSTIKHSPEFMKAIEELTRQHGRAPLATYYARWSTGRNGRGAKGPWSMPAAMTVVATGRN